MCNRNLFAKAQASYNLGSKSHLCFMWFKVLSTWTKNKIIIYLIEIFLLFPFYNSFFFCINLRFDNGVYMQVSDNHNSNVCINRYITLWLVNLLTLISCLLKLNLVTNIFYTLLKYPVKFVPYYVLAPICPVKHYLYPYA